MAKINFITPKEFQKIKEPIKNSHKPFTNLGGLKDVVNENLKTLEEIGSPRAVQKDFGDYKLLVRRVSKEELSHIPEAEVIATKISNKKD